MKGCKKEFYNKNGEIDLCHEEDCNYNESFCEECRSKYVKESGGGQ